MLEPRAVVVEEQQRLLVLHHLAVLADHVVGVTVGEEQIDVPVVVVVEELQAPAAEKPRRLRDAVGRGDVREELAAVVLVKREHLLVDVGDEEILLAVAVEVGRVHAHAGPRRAVGAERDFRREADLFPFALAAVREQEVLHRVVRDEEVHQPVVVDIGSDDAEGLAEGALDVGAAARQREGAVAVVVIERAGRRLEDARNAVEALSELVVAAEDVVLQRELDEAAEKQIELAVVVVVEPDGACRPVRRAVEARRLR